MEQKNQVNVLEAKMDLLAQQVTRGFSLMEKSFEAVTEDITEVRSDMSEVKKDVGQLKEQMIETNSRLTLIERRLDTVEEGLDEVKGFSKDIDHVLDRTVAIERHLGIEPVEAA